MCILALGAAIAVTTVSCEREEPVKEPLKESGIFVTVGAGISDAATKSEVASEDGKRVLKFTAGDKLYVCNPDFDDNHSYHLTGILEIESLSTDGKSARFSGEVKVYRQDGRQVNSYDFSGIVDPLEETTAYLIHAGTTQGIDYSISNSDHDDYALDYNLQDAAEVETLMTQCLPVTGAYNSGTESYSLSCPYPIFNCTLSGLEASHEYNYRFGKDIGGGWFQRVSSGSFTTDANGNAHIAFFSYTYNEGAWELRIEDDDTSALVGTVDLGTRTFTSKVYNISRFWNGTAFRTYTNLSSIATDYTASDGEVLTGTLANNVQISIADGAAVWLSGVSINADAAWTSTDHSGITCLGDATINLAGGTTNTVRGRREDYPGLQAGPTSTTLTIQGLGTLNAYARQAAAIGGAAYIDCGNIVIEGGIINADCSGEGNDGTGIGAGNNARCGSITINGGNITATASGVAAGIGTSGSYSICGAITISGGTVVAIGSDYGPGIGAGYDLCTCGNITINTGITSVTATRGSETYISVDPRVYSDPCIGAMLPGEGKNYCGSIYFGEVEMNKSKYTSYPYTSLNWYHWPESGNDYGGLHIVISNEDHTWTLTPATP